MLTAVEELILQNQTAVQTEFQRLVSLAESQASKDEMREAIYSVERVLQTLEQAPHDLEHLFLPGLYIRVAHILPGTLFTTPIYKEECILTMLRGRLAIFSEDGGLAVTPPAFVMTKIGVKRAIFAIDDVLAHTVHPNPDDERDIKKLEARIYTQSFDDVEINGSLL